MLTSTILGFVFLLFVSSNAQSCTANLDCLTTSLSACVGSVCGLCSSQSDCNHLDDTPFCETSGCVECLIGSDCESKYGLTSDDVSCISNTCKETCGDGFNMGVFACDDGNTVDGDGCNSQCSVEPGYICFGGDKDQADICVKTGPALLAAPVGNAESILDDQLLVYFDQSMLVSKDINSIAEIILFNDYNTNIVQKFEFIRVDCDVAGRYNCYQVTLYFKESFENRDIQISFDSDYMRNGYGQAVAEPIELNLAGFVTELYGYREVIQALLDEGRCLEYIMYGLGIMCLFTKNFYFWIITMIWMQYMSNISYLEFKLPPDFRGLMNMFDFARAERIPNFFKDLVGDEALRMPPLPFASEGVSANFIAGGGKTIIFLLFIVIFYLIYFFVFWAASQNKFVKFFQKFFIWTFIIQAVNVAYLELNFRAALQYTNMFVDSFTFSECLALGVGIFTLLVPLLVYLIIRNGQSKLNRESFKEKYQSLYAYLNPLNKNLNGIILWSYGKRILYVVILVLFSALDLSGVQTILLAILAFLDFGILLLMRPYKVFLVAVTQTMSAFLMFMVYLLFLLREINMSFGSKYYLTWAIICMTISITLIHILSLTSMIFSTIFEKKINKSANKNNNPNIKIEIEAPRKTRKADRRPEGFHYTRSPGKYLESSIEESKRTNLLEPRNVLSNGSIGSRNLGEKSSSVISTDYTLDISPLRKARRKERWEDKGLFSPASNNP